MRRARYLDLLERSGWTFVQGAASEWLVTQSLDAQTVQVALVAGLAAVLKALVAFRVGDSHSAALLP